MCLFVLFVHFVLIKFSRKKKSNSLDNLITTLLKIHSLIFLWTPKGFISPEYFFNFFLNLYIPPWLRKSFKFIVLRLPENTFKGQKIKLILFYSSPQVKLSPRFLSLPTDRRKLPIPTEQRFLKICFSPAEMREDYGVEKLLKLNLRGYWSQVLMNSTIFAIFTIFGFCFVVQ